MRRPRFYYGWIVVATLLLVNFSAHASATFTFGLFVLPMSADLGVSRSTIGWMQTTRLASAGVSSLVLGPIVDRYGPRILIPVAALLASAAVLGLGLARDLWVLFALFSILGLSGLTGPGALLTSVPVAKWFVRRRGRAIAIATLGMAAGGAIFALVHQALIDSLGWRGALLVSSTIIVALAVPLPAILLRRTPEDIGLLPDGRTAPSERPASIPEPPPEPEWTVTAALRTTTFWKIVAASTLGLFAAGGFVVHRPGFWVAHGIDEGLIAMAYALDSVVFAMTALTAGFLVERFPARYVGAVAMAVNGVAVVWALLRVSELDVLGASALLGGGAGANVVVQTYIWAQYYGRSFLGSIRGIVLPITLVGFGLGPPLIGMLYDATGGDYVPGFWILVALLLVAAAILATARPPGQERAWGVPAGGTDAPGA